MATTQRPITYFDINIGDKAAGRVIFSLYNDLVPKTAENFRTWGRRTLISSDILKTSWNRSAMYGWSWYRSIWEAVELQGIGFSPCN